MLTFLYVVSRPKQKWFVNSACTIQQGEVDPGYKKVFWVGHEILKDRLEDIDKKEVPLILCKEGRFIYNARLTPLS